MNQKQKEAILKSLGSDLANRSYENRYWFPYDDFFDITDDFTAFSCERLDGKQGYIDLIDNLFRADEDAKVFVEVYGFEEDYEDTWIYADDLIIFSKLSLTKIEQIFNNVENIFPSEIGEFNFNSGNYFIIDKNGHFVSTGDLSYSDYFVYDCWWDCFMILSLPGIFRFAFFDLSPQKRGLSISRQPPNQICNSKSMSLYLCS